jgi:hypothetical protein
MSNGHIFISYRRDDSAGFTRAIYDQLAKRFTKERIFMDVDAIEPGLPFDEVINQAVGRCEILLAMIGKRWMEQQPGVGPRINDEKDFVRLEVGAALARNVRVIPVLLDGAGMPTEESLPEPIRALARRNAIEISNSRFNSDVDRLVEAVAKVLGESKVPPRQERPLSNRAMPYWPLGWVIVVALVSSMAYFYFNDATKRTGRQQSTSEDGLLLSVPRPLSPADRTSFAHFPRAVTLAWEAVPSARGYKVEIEFGSGDRPQWSTFGSITNVNATTYTFDFIGAQPGRWRVWAVDAKGHDGPKSDWWVFFFTR